MTLTAEETRITDPTTGGEKGQKTARFDLIPVEPLWEVACLYGVGAAKYDDRNWERGYKYSLSYAAAMRHLVQFWNGESIDSENGRHHLSSVIFHAMAMMEFEAKHKGTDDRPIQRPEQSRELDDIRKNPCPAGFPFGAQCLLTAGHHGRCLIDVR